MGLESERGAVGISRTDTIRTDAPGPRKLAHVNRADQLIYLADVIGEFRTLASDLGADTLSELLQIGQSEALREAERVR